MYEVVLLSKKWGTIIDSWKYRKTPEGLEKAREKRSELLAKFLDNDVELHRIDDRN